MTTYDYTKLKALREERSLTQKQVANLLGIGQSAYNKLERANRKRKYDSILDIETLANAFQLPPQRLISILTNQNDIRSAGIKESDLWAVHQMLKDDPLREDEFVLFTTEVVDIHQYGFKKHYSFNLSETDDDDQIPMWRFEEPISIFIAASVEIGFEYENKKLKSLSVWLGKKKLGVVPQRYLFLLDALIMELMISRVLLIENDESVAGFPDTYMKLVFIASNAICKTSKFEKGRFKNISLMTEQEVKEANNEN